MLTQTQLEERMVDAGFKRASAMFDKAESTGNVDRTGYAQWVFDDYVRPIAAAVDEEVNSPKPSRARKYVALLRGLDAMTIAYLSIRVVLNMLVSATTNSSGERHISQAIGTTINRELVLAQIEFQSPELFHTLTEDLGRRMSKNERHRINMMRVSAKKAGIVWHDWEPGDRLSVGQYLLGLLVDAGLAEFDDTTITTRPSKNGRGSEALERTLHLAQHVVDRMSAIKTFIAGATPFFGPCVEPPMDWVNYRDGGFHTKRLRARAGRLIKCPGALRDWVYDAEPSQTVLDAANMLQRTGWVVNKRILDTALALSSLGVTTKEIVSNVRRPPPDKPVWLVPGMGKDSMNEDQLAEFLAWKQRIAKYHTDAKLAGAKFGRFYQATRMAEEYKEYPHLYFVYFADSRGRFYPRTTGLNPQGSDLQKALLKFDTALPITDERARFWFMVHGANKWGFDKAPLAERAEWAAKNDNMIVNCAENPVAYQAWLGADKPMQFLAWAFEYRDYRLNPEAATSALPISMDGSCNGLQNLSALLRDPIGGEATNLTRSEKMQDIYMRVADATRKRMLALPPSPIRDVWLNHGITRAAVKRTVMTTPYGVTRRTSTEYVIYDYLADNPALFPREQRIEAANVLLSCLWPAIGDVIVKGREAMDWLSKGARHIDMLDMPDAPVTWTSPSGFPAGQAYFEKSESRVRTRICGKDRQLVIVQETATASRSRHSTAMSPNFVHSLDAAHLHLVSAELLRCGVTHAAMIHDDYGTHAAHSDTMYRVIREQFVRMYEDNDPLEALRNRYPEFGAPPEHGSLNIRGVLDSEFFFS